MTTNSKFTVNKIQLGQSATDDHNFILENDNGSLVINRGTTSNVISEVLNTDGSTLTIQQQSSNMVGDNHIRKIGVMYHSFYALTYSNKIYTWGYNAGGQLGDGSTSVSEVMQVQFPKYLEGVEIVDMGAYINTVYVLFANGELYGWGSNAYGQLGLGDTTTRAFPVRILTNVERIFYPPSRNQNDHASYPYVYIFAKMNDGSYKCAGFNVHGNLGIGNLTNQTSWTSMVIPAGKTIENIWIGTSPNNASFMKTTDGNIYACGYNGNGQLGIGNSTDQTSWVYVPNLPTDIIDIQSGYYYFDGTTGANYQNTVALSSSGNVYTCGNNVAGTLGDGTTTARTTFDKVNLTKPVKKIIKVVHSVYVIFTDNTYARWGYNGYGQLGTGNTTNQLSPAYGSFAVQDIFFITRTGQHSYASYAFLLGMDNKLYVCGQNPHGQLGTGNTTQVNTPTAISLNNTDIKEILSTGGASGATTCILPRNSDTLYLCGYNANGELGILPNNGSKYIFRQLKIK